MRPHASTYERMKADAANPDRRVRARLAADPTVPPEILYFLATDSAPEVRREVAYNPTTPPQANLILAQDPDYGVRVHLAKKFAAGGLSERQRQRLWRMSSTAFEMLVADALLQVRQILAEAVKALADVPRGILLALARDPEPAVAEPVLRESPMLTDSDLLDIMAARPVEWTRSAIAGRQKVSPMVSAAIVASGSERAIGTLVANRGAEFDSRSLETLTANERWKEAVKARETSVPSDTQPRRPSSEEPTSGGAVDAKAKPRDGGQEALALFNAGKLDADTVFQGLERGDREFVAAALALRAGLPLAVVNNILNARSPRRITALAWKAGCSMRFAVELQARIARIAPRAILYARNGVEFPLSPAEMEDQLSLFID